MTVVPIVSLMLTAFVQTCWDELTGSRWYQDLKLGRSVRQSSEVIRSAADEMRQTAGARRAPRPSWRDW